MSEAAAGAKKAPEKKVAPKAEKKAAPAKKEAAPRSFVQQIHDRKNRAFDKKLTK